MVSIVFCQDGLSFTTCMFLIFGDIYNSRGHSFEVNRKSQNYELKYCGKLFTSSLMCCQKFMLIIKYLKLTSQPYPLMRMTNKNVLVKPTRNNWDKA